MRRIMVLVIVVLMLFLVACNKEIETNMSKDVMDFEFTTQDKETLSLEELKGKWWIADFIFTNCTTVCLPMTSNMSTLQDKINEEALDVQLVSFSVDPENDTPEVLKEYAESYQADLENWAFLTGYDFETIQELSEKSFMSALEMPPAGSDQVLHGTRFYLVNPEGVVIKSYNGVETETIEDIISDLKMVVE